jgi:hypothetical protein
MVPRCPDALTGSERVLPGEDTTLEQVLALLAGESLIPRDEWRARQMT